MHPDSYPKLARYKSSTHLLIYLIYNDASPVPEVGATQIITYLLTYLLTNY